MFKFTLRAALGLTLLAGPLVAPATSAAQGLPPIILRDQNTARGALREVDGDLSAALKSRSRDGLLRAIQKFQQTIAALADLGYEGLQVEVTRSRGLYYQALGTLLDVMAARCEGGSLVDGLAAGDMLRGLDAKTRQALGERAVESVSRRVPNCLALELKIDSRITDVKSGFVRHMEVKVPLTYDLASNTYQGEGPVTKLAQRVPPLEGKCQVAWPTKAATFTVRNLQLQRDGDFTLKDVVLDGYEPGAGSDDITLSCMGTSVKMSVPNWGGTFLTARHFGGGASLTAWRIGVPTGVVASKQIEQTVAGVLVEATDVLLVRRPRR